jgi:hypothetical protein
MPSITTWTRLEPRARDEGMDLAARIHDPLWLLARQWQLAEFRGEDAGSPVEARLRAEVSPLTRYRAGPGGGGAVASAYDPSALPLEALAEREPVRRPEDAAGPSPRTAAEAGLHFLRRLGPLAPRYRAAYVARYPLRPAGPEERRALHPDELLPLGVMAGRVPDGVRLAADLRAALGPFGEGTLPTAPAVQPADRAAVTRAAAAFLGWYEGLFSEPSPGVATAWVANRLEYSFAVSAPTPAGEVSLAAPGYPGGRLDWYSFVAAGVGAAKAPGPELIRSAIPAPVAFPGMPADRYWELEDARGDFGAAEAGPDDLAGLLLVEFALAYANDWFLVPVPLPVGSLCRIRSLVVADTFGQRTLIRPAGQADGASRAWRMFRLSADRRAGQGDPAADLFFLPPALAAGLEGPPIEEVEFTRDEVANVAWAVELTAEGLDGRPRNRSEDAPTGLPPPPGAPSASSPLVYRLASGLPANWVPFVPVRAEGGASRLRRGTLSHALPAMGPAPAPPRGRLLAEMGGDLLLHEEEVPRAGARVTRAYQYARWVDGSAHLWVGRRKRPGRGERSSGLRFDVADPAAAGPP